MKYVFVGDIHGKHDIVEEALQQDGRIVFVGDFLDSFNESPENQIKCINTVLNAITLGKADAIPGNHELGYIYDQHSCSRWKDLTRRLFQPLIPEVLKLFVPFMQIGDEWLVTHAGAVQEVLPTGTSPTLDWANDLDSSAHWIGRSRGGFNYIGGIWWCDFNREFEPIPGLNQIFGHTAGRDIRIKTGVNSINYCIDCLDSTKRFLTLDL